MAGGGGRVGFPKAKGQLFSPDLEQSQNAVGEGQAWGCSPSAVGGESGEIGFDSLLSEEMPSRTAPCGPSPVLVGGRQGGGCPPLHAPSPASSKQVKAGAPRVSGGLRTAVLQAGRGWRA